MKSDSELSLDDAEATFNLLAEILDRFIAAWEAAPPPPKLAEFLPEGGVRRRLILTDLIKTDLEYRWDRQGVPRRIEEYVEEFPELAEQGIPAELIYEEFHRRRQSGLPTNLEDYLARFPEQATELARLLGGGAAYESTMVYQANPKRNLDQFRVGETREDFALLALLGEGAFARVFLARQNSMQRLVALKVSANRGTEHQTLAQMDHDFIVRVFDLRVLPEQGLRLLHMQYIRGGTLQGVVSQLKQTPQREWSGRTLLRAIDCALENRGETRPSESAQRARLERLDWPTVVAWLGLRLARALQYAHNLKTLHRDVKPANVLLTPEGDPKLADFNISFSANVAGATPAAYFGGSLAYMSPEQLEACNPLRDADANALDGRSDIYSLGVLLWELLTAERPFQDEKVENNWVRTLEAMTERRRHGAPTAGDSLPPRCPPRLLTAIRVCLSPEKEDRWRNGEALARQLDLCLKPHAQKLLTLEKADQRRTLSRWGVWILVLIGLIPNALAGHANLVYNRQAIIKPLGDHVEEAFVKTYWTINSIAFPLGVGLGLYWLWSFFRVAQGLLNQPGLAGRPAENRPALRRRCLMFGNSYALLCLTLWLVAGMAYPITIRSVSGLMPVGGYVHFFGSLFICGAIAIAFPFFLMTWYCLRVYYPILLQGDLTRTEDRPHLLKLKRYGRPYLIAAFLAPMLAILLLAVMGPGRSVAQSNMPGFLIGLSLAGIGGFLSSFLIWGKLEDDLDAILDAVQTE